MVCQQQKMALMKFQIIAPALNQSDMGQMDYFRKMATKEHVLPGTDTVFRFQAGTFKKWLHIYRKKGFDGLVPTSRKDLGRSRRIAPETSKRIREVTDKYSFRTARALFEYLLDMEILQPRQCSYTTFNAYAKKHRLTGPRSDGKQRKSFEKEFVNMMWVGDIMYGPYVQGGRHGIRSYLVAFMDDHSRFITGAKFCVGQDSIAVEETLKQAIATYGLPARLYLDNGKVFTTEHLVMAGARLGFQVVHSKPGDSASRGKIERYYRTVRDGFLDTFMAACQDARPTLEELNSKYTKWLQERYQLRKNSRTRESPHDRYMKGIAKVKIRQASPEHIKSAFLHVITRTVSKDALVSIDNIDYEVPGNLISKRIELSFDLSTPSVYYVVDEATNETVAVRPVNRHRNSNFPLKFDGKNKPEEEK
jgi:transposase InsO family protein